MPYDKTPIAFNDPDQKCEHFCEVGQHVWSHYDDSKHQHCFIRDQHNLVCRACFSKAREAQKIQSEEIKAQAIQRLNEQLLGTQKRIASIPEDDFQQLRELVEEYQQSYKIAVEALHSRAKKFTVDDSQWSPATSPFGLPKEPKINTGKKKESKTNPNGAGRKPKTPEEKLIEQMMSFGMTQEAAKQAIQKVKK